VHSILFDSSVHLRRGGQLDCETQADQTFRLRSTTNPFLKFQCLILLPRIAISSRCPDSAGFVAATISKTKSTEQQPNSTHSHSESGSFYRTNVDILRLTSQVYLLVSSSLSSFLSSCTSINIHPQPANILWSFAHQHINTPSPHQISLINKDILPIKHKPHQTHRQQEQAIMSDASDSTFTAGETKLLISIIKNLTGDLQVCLLSFSPRV
jgi:hypothetical protein